MGFGKTASWAAAIIFFILYVGTMIIGMMNPLLGIFTWIFAWVFGALFFIFLVLAIVFTVIGR